MHADHITGTGILKKLIPNSKSVISAKSKAVADIAVNNGEVLDFGSHHLEVRETPGHTNGEFFFFFLLRFADIFFSISRHFFNSWLTG